MRMDTRLLNVVILGFGFMCVFTSFQTMGNIEETVLSAVRNETSSFTGNGYTSLAIIYSVFAVSNWVAPSVISLTSPKIAIILGSIVYMLFILSFLVLNTILLYVMSAVLGFAAAILWTGQGTYLILNSDKTTIGRNSGVFWAMVQCSLFIGNIFVYFQFQGPISKKTRTIVFIVLGSISALSVVVLCLLRRPKQADGTDAIAVRVGPITALKNSFKLFATKEMLLLLLTFFYTGVELSFFSSVYSTSIGNTKSFGSQAKSLVGLSGVFVGVGEVLGGVAFSFTHKLKRCGRDPIVVFGFCIHVLAFFLIFINLPNESPTNETSDSAYIHSDVYIALFCSFLLGLGDCCFNTQIYALLGSIWAVDSAPAVAIYKCVQAVGSATAFFYGRLATLQIHLGVLISLAVLSTVTYCVVEWIYRVRERSRNDNPPMGTGEGEVAKGRAAE